LGTLETLLMGTASRLEEKQDEVNRLNEQMAAIFAKGDNVWTRGQNQGVKVWSESQGGPYRFAGSSKEVTITTANPVNKGTLMSSGVHRWRVKCLSIGSYCDLGVVSPSHHNNTTFNNNAHTAWGI
jgi:hypothetical protein